MINKKKLLLLFFCILFILLALTAVIRIVELNYSYTYVINACTNGSSGAKCSAYNGDYYYFSDKSIYKYPSEEIADISLLGSFTYSQIVKEQKIYFDCNGCCVYDMACRKNTEFDNKNLELMGVFNNDIFLADYCSGENDIPEVVFYKFNQITGELKNMTEILLADISSDITNFSMVNSDGCVYIYLHPERKIIGIVTPDGDIIGSSLLGFYNNAFAISGDGAEDITIYNNDKITTVTLPHGYTYDERNVYNTNEKLYIMAENNSKEIPSRTSQRYHKGSKLLCIDIETAEMTSLYQTDDYIVAYSSEYVWLYNGNKTLKKCDIAREKVIGKYKLKEKPKYINFENCKGKIFVWDDYDNILIDVLDF